MKNEWIKCSDELPPENKEVLTKIDDGDGVRNVQSLKWLHNLWWHPDLSAYVYYTPTHWQRIF